MHLHHSFHKIDKSWKNCAYWNPSLGKWGKIQPRNFNDEDILYSEDEINAYTTDEIYQKYFPDGKIETGIAYHKKFGISHSHSVFPRAVARTVAFGACAIRKDAVDSLADEAWNPSNFVFMRKRRNKNGIGEDYEFFMRAIQRFNKGLQISYPLYYYSVNHLTSNVADPIT